jgi:hypothetical protein
MVEYLRRRNGLLPNQTFGNEFFHVPGTTSENALTKWDFESHARQKVLAT